MSSKQSQSLDLLNIKVVSDNDGLAIGISGATGSQNATLLLASIYGTRLGLERLEDRLRGLIPTDKEEEIVAAAHVLSEKMRQIPDSPDIHKSESDN